jgi:WW domain-containing oxidoreductase
MSKIPYGERSTADNVLAGVDLSRKTIVVTECDSPVGAETMKALAANGARVIGLARSADLARVACREAGSSSTPLACDMRSEESAAAAVAALKLQGPLDAIIVNSTQVPGAPLAANGSAGAQLRTDHIACFLFVTLLVDSLCPRASRIVIENGGSEDHASALLAREFSRRVIKRGIAVNSFSTTPAKPQGQSTLQGLATSVSNAVARLRRRSPAQLAATPALLAASPNVAGASGLHWSACQISGFEPRLDAPSAAGDLWGICEQRVLDGSPANDAAQDMWRQSPAMHG